MIVFKKLIILFVLVLFVNLLLSLIIVPDEFESPTKYRLMICALKGVVLLVHICKKKEGKNYLSLNELNYLYEPF